MSCDREELIVIENQFDINIDGTEYQSINENVYGNENCNTLYVNANYFFEDTRFSILFDVSKEGDLIKVWYKEYDKQINSFLLPNFDLLSTFTISDFYYDSITEEVKFNFEGTLYFEDNNTISRNISGKISIKELNTTDCRAVERSLYYDSDNFDLFVFAYKNTEFENQTQLHRFFLNNGFRIYLNLSDDLWFYPLGEINFDENSQTDKVEFAKYTGTLVADQIQRINEEDWKNFETSGQLIIEEKYTEKGDKMIRGKINLVVKDNGETLYTLNGIDFKTNSFE
jgi:hypothetical protein